MKNLLGLFGCLAVVCAALFLCAPAMACGNGVCGACAVQLQNFSAPVAVGAPVYSAPVVAAPIVAAPVVQYASPVLQSVQVLQAAPVVAAPVYSSVGVSNVAVLRAGRMRNARSVSVSRVRTRVR